MKIESPYEFGTPLQVLVNGEWEPCTFVGREDEGYVFRLNCFRSSRIYTSNLENVRSHPIATKKKRLLTAKELAGKWIRTKGETDCASFCWSYSGDKFTAGTKYIDVADHHEWTNTPADDSSWKSVQVTE